MKYIHLFAAITLCFLFTISCDRDLPYPLEDVKRGVVIDIVRTSGTDGVLYVGQAGGNYKLTLTIPKQQGDYSSLDHVQLLCVFTDVAGTVTSQVVEDNIKEFPAEITIDLVNVYSQFGLIGPALGEVLQFTTNAVLKDGYVIDGWNQYSGFNNRAFSGWKVDERPYSYNVRYPVVCQLNLDDFVGTMTIDDEFWEDIYNVEVTKISDTELAIDGLFEGEAEIHLILTIDPEAYTVTVAKQVLVADISGWLGAPVGSYTNFYLAGSGTIDACKGTISFTAEAALDQGGFGDVHFELSH